MAVQPVRWRTPVFATLGALLLMLAAVAGRPANVATALTNCTLPQGDPSISAVELELLGILNDYRAEHGAGPLAISQTLSHSATWMAVDMGLGGYFAHTEPSGRRFTDRVHDCGYPPGGWEGENIAGGNPLASAQAVFEAWQDSPGHDANMLKPEYVYVGIALEQVAGSEYGHYWVTDFGSLADAPPPPAPTATPTVAPPTATAAPPTPAPPTPTPAPPTPTPVPPSPTATPTAQPPLPTPTPVATTPSGVRQAVGVSGGDTFLEWQGAPTSAGDVIAELGQGVRAIYTWDSAGEQWKRYVPGEAGWLNTLPMLEPGHGYWFVSG